MKQKNKQASRVKSEGNHLMYMYVFILKLVLFLMWGNPVRNKSNDLVFLFQNA